MGSTCLFNEKVLVLEPSELHFGGPLLRPTITLVTLKNPNDFDVMYKFKTTAPRIYRVRPNLGIVSSHGDKTVRIVLMPFSFELKERLVHKFMVLTAPAPDDFSDLRKVWAGLDEAKLRCEKFKSIIEMARPLVPTTLEISSSSTSAECEQEPPVSCTGDTSQSEDNIPCQNLTKTLTPNTPRFDKEAVLTELRAENNKLRDLTEVLAVLGELRTENNKLRDLNDVLRLENKQLAIELERIRDVKVEVAVEGSMATATANEPKRATSVGKTNKFMLFLATSMTMAIVCAMIGKFVYPEKVNFDGLQSFL